MHGGFRVQRADGQNQEDGFVGQKLYVGDRLETDGNGYSKIVFQDRSDLALGKSSSLRLTEFLFSAQQQKRRGLVKLYRGTAHLTVEPMPRWSVASFEVQTKGALGSVRGTDFVVQVFSDGRTKFFLISGYVEVKGRNGLGPTVLLAQMQTSTVPLGGDPTFAASFAAAELSPLFNELGENLPVPVPENSVPQGGAPVLANAQDETRGVKQSEWAKMLIEKLGITDEGLLTEEDYAAFLAGGRSQSVEAEQSDNKMEYLVRIDDPKASGGAFVEAKKLSGTLRFSTFSAREGRFPVKAVVKGRALVTVNDQTFVVEDDGQGTGLRPHDLGQVDMKKGENFFNVVLSKGSAMDLVQIDSRCTDPIAPEGGWGMGNDLNFGQKAETMVQAMNQEGRYPLDTTFVAYLKAVNAYETKGEVEKVDLNSDPQNNPRPALKAPSRNATARWRIKLPAQGLYSFSTQSAGGSPLLWSADGCDLGKNMPDSQDVPAGWQEFATKMLTQGDHILEVSIPPGAILEGVRITKRKGGPANALQVLNDLGFNEGAMGESVSLGKAKENLRNGLFGKTTGGVLPKPGGGLDRPGPEWGKPYIDDYPFPGGTPYIPDVFFPGGGPVSPVLPTL